MFFFFDFGLDKEEHIKFKHPAVNPPPASAALSYQDLIDPNCLSFVKTNFPFARS